MNIRQSGATAVEFALVLVIFLTFLLGILDFSRMLFTWNAANEATRAGARYAVVCDDTENSAQVLSKMQALLPQIQSINLAWVPTNCNAATCEGVTLTITNLDYQWISPIAGLAKLPAIRMPSFSTYLPREVMRKDPNSPAICS
ncbi:TadE family protein [Polaromonas sp.]|uniref:TadE/TadG family type IV pilus assembly protein n=1 Tax=Polaromonas sp. TaxID=1869339 RepID=UPI001D90D359|nr:TadE family protein [Polaromonas sp.]MBT9476797.1 pilus assembly protein [Polaromonas sp.]